MKLVLLPVRYCWLNIMLARHGSRQSANEISWFWHCRQNTISGYSLAYGKCDIGCSPLSRQASISRVPVSAAHPKDKGWSAVYLCSSNSWSQCLQYAWCVGVQQWWLCGAGVCAELAAWTNCHLLQWGVQCPYSLHSIHTCRNIGVRISEWQLYWISGSQTLSLHRQVKVSCKSKVKLSCYMLWMYLRGRRYSSCLFLTLTLNEDEWSASHPGKGPPVPVG
jgi:hypothetical protein